MRLLSNAVVIAALALAPISAWADEGPKSYPANDPRVAELRQGVDRASHESERIQREFVGKWIYQHEIGRANVGFRWKTLTIGGDSALVLEYQVNGSQRVEVVKGRYEFIHRGTPEEFPGKRPLVLVTPERAEGAESGDVMPLLEVTVGYDAHVPVKKGMVLKFSDLEGNEFVFLRSRASATLYTVKDVYPLPQAYVFGSGINSRGEIVGYALGGAQFTNVIEHGFVSSNGAITDFATLPAFAGWRATWAKAVNSVGQVAGDGDAPHEGNSGDRAFLYSAGQKTAFGGAVAHANAINDLGEIVGRSSNRALLYSAGKLTDLGTLGGSASEARGINSAGQIVGYSTTTNDEWHAFLYSEGRMRDLGTLGGTSSDAYALNAQGRIVGRAKTAGGDDHAFLYLEGEMLDLGTLGGDVSEAKAINDQGDIVGLSSTADGRVHAFLYSNGKMTDLNTVVLPGSGLELDRANGINNAGQIVGTGHYATSPAISAPVAYLLTPVPVLTNPTLSDGAFHVSVATAPAQAYVLEHSGSLLATNWIALPPFVGDGTVKVLTNLPATAPYRFYRLRMQ